MTRPELIKQIESGEAKVVVYKTQRTLFNFLLNRALEDDRFLLSSLETNDKQTFILVVQTLSPNEPRAGQSI
jgi:hypothetical protein